MISIRAASILMGVRERPVAADGEHVVLELDLEVVGVQTRDVHVDGDAVVVDQQVRGRDECPPAALGAHDLAKLAQDGCERLNQCGCH